MPLRQLLRRYHNRRQGVIPAVLQTSVSVAGSCLNTLLDRHAVVGPVLNVAAGKEAVIRNVTIAASVQETSNPLHGLRHRRHGYALGYGVDGPGEAAVLGDSIGYQDAKAAIVVARHRDGAALARTIDQDVFKSRDVACKDVGTTLSSN
jgi:hypothetical protein